MSSLRLSLAEIPTIPFFLLGGQTTMFAARLRPSLQPFFHGIHSSYLSHIRGIAAISKRILLDRFNNEENLRLFGNEVGIKHFYIPIHSSSQCYSSKSVVDEKTLITLLFTSPEDDMFSELGSVKKDQNSVLKLLTSVPESPQKTKGTKKKKKKKCEQTSDSISKLKLLTEKPGVSWKTNGKSKEEVHVSYSKPSKSLSSIRNHVSNRSKVSSNSNTPTNHTPSVGNLNSKTTDSIIHSTGLSVGPLEGLAQLNKDTVDVVFRARNLNEAESILEKLNDATIDQSQWSAEIVPEAKEECIAVPKIWRSN